MADVRVAPGELVALSDELIALWETGDSMIGVLGRQIREHNVTHPEQSCATCAEASAAVFRHYGALGRIAQHVNKLAVELSADHSVETLIGLAKQAEERGRSTSRAVRRRALRRIK